MPGRLIPARAGNTLTGRRHGTRAPAHPRSRGEHCYSVLDFASLPGSSPLARGTRANQVQQKSGFRLIPARAGNTKEYKQGVTVDSAHPRSRGEHTHRDISGAPRSGSSPLARGTPQPGRSRIFPIRLIPARAGNTQATAATAFRLPAHPRSRGEHNSSATTRQARTGSSPLARGTLLRQLVSQFRIRLIPARAGNTRNLSSLFFSASAHPRSRGEHLDKLTRAVMDSGSSPLARGTLTCRVMRISCRRLIPARAGNTSAPVTPNLSFSAHPRSRGEHASLHRRISTLVGSSPLARGTPHQPPIPAWLRRLIPARAGNTRRTTVILALTAAHPRSRGEHSVTERLPLSCVGSSPLARGTLQPGHQTAQRQRLIPARAGNTENVYVVETKDSAHPRSRGEHARLFTASCVASGSSPLARGTRCLGGREAFGQRLIPARAGNTHIVQSPPGGGTAHPRSRGEHEANGGSKPAAVGSSPLARGTLAGVLRIGVAGRLIPARAGNTKRSRILRYPATAHPRSRGEHTL